MAVGPDKVGKNTGPGDGTFLVTDNDSDAGVVMEFILFNYNIDGNLLKPEHKKALDEHVIPFLREGGVHAELTGTASRTGDAAYNRQLSLERVDRVRAYLLGKGLTAGQVPKEDMKAVGEDKSTSKVEEDELERSVRIRIVVGLKMRPVIPGVVIPHVPPANPALPNTLPEVLIVGSAIPFAIQELSGVNAGVGVGVSAFFVGVGAQAGAIEYHFLLVNLRTREMVQARFAGVAVSGSAGLAGKKPGISAGPGISFTKGSHTWDKFSAPVGTTFESFESSATWVEPFGVGLNTAISAQAILTIAKINTVIRVTTGVTLGSPGSAASIGTFHVKLPPSKLQL